MFSTFTWYSFFQLGLILVLGYYTGTIIFFYRKEVSSWLRNRIKPSEQAFQNSAHKSVTQESFIGPVDTSSPSPVRTSVTDKVNIVLSEQNDQGAPDLDSPIGFLLGPVSDLLEEVRSLVDLITESQTGKQDSRDLFHALLIRYPQLVGSPYQHTISEYIVEAAKAQFSFDLSIDEVKTWWTRPE